MIGIYILILTSFVQMASAQDYQQVVMDKQINQRLKGFGRAADYISEVDFKPKEICTRVNSFKSIEP